MDRTKMLDALIEHFANGNKSRFANILGVRPQTISTWYSRNTFDAVLIFAKCEGVSGDWLLSGKGDMVKDNHVSQSEVSPTPQPWEEFVGLIAEEVRKRMRNG